MADEPIDAVPVRVRATHGTIPHTGLGTKFRPPSPRRGTVERTALVQRLEASDSPVIMLVAPPGYGKTTVLAQWAERLGSKVAWVSCDRTDNDPAALWAAVAASVDAVAGTGPGPAQVLSARGGGVDVVPAFVAALEQASSPMTIVLDHLEEVSSQQSRAAIAEFVIRVPEGWRVALASRERLPVATARLRAEGKVTELGPMDLAMSVQEAEALLTGADVHTGARAASDLVELTEGWPVGLYLGGLSLHAGNRLEEASAGGGDRWITDYLSSELIANLSGEEVRFLVRTSLVERLSGPLCDALLDTSGSARTLERLVGRTMLVLPLDRHREWYRYHHLLRDHLLGELRMDHQDETPRLHARASAWFEANGMPEEAVEHAIAAGDATPVGRLVLELMSPVWASGRAGTVLRWMHWLARHPSAPHKAALMAHGSLMYALLGRAAEAEEMAAHAQRLPATGTLPDGSTVAATISYLRANLAPDGIASMREDARAAVDGLAPSSPFRATMLHVEGVSHLLEGGSLDAADADLAHAADLAAARGNSPLVSLILAERSLVASGRADRPAADSFAHTALAMIDDGGFDGYWTSALVLAAAARAAARNGDIPAARRLARRASLLRPLLTYALPVVSVQALVELAHAYVGFAEVDGARAVLSQAGSILQQRPLLGTLVEELESLNGRVGPVAGTARGASSLTAAELRLVPLLPTHLTMPEIGEQLHLSRHTVKSQVISLYRKLGVSSRSGAVARLSELHMDG
jgi:LuxR family transcriptional regulator, maltose regulon positive regulatory protein